MNLLVFFLYDYTIKIIPLCVSHQSSSVRVDAVGRVGELQAGFGVQGQLLVVVEPAVLWSWESLVLQASQLGGRANCDGLWNAAPRHDRFDCTQTDKMWMVQAFLPSQLSNKPLLHWIRWKNTQCWYSGAWTACLGLQWYNLQLTAGCVTFSFWFL